MAREAETAGTLLPPGEQEYVSHQIAQNINKLYKQQKQHLTHDNKQTNNENRVINRIKGKLTKKRT